MSEATDETADPQGTPDASGWGEGADWFLQHLVRLVNSRAFVPLPVTLTVGGIQISGEIIPRSEYFTALGDQLGKSYEEAAPGAPELAEAVRSGITQFASINYGEQEDSDAPEDGHSESPPVAPNYIHLRNVRLHSGQVRLVHANDPLLWRGRLDKVDGFHLGMPE